jgi:two-component system sensor histidine kinase ChvG
MSARLPAKTSRSPGTRPRRWPFSSLTRQIVVLNVIALLFLLGGVLYLNQSRQSLIDARLSSLREQAEIMAAGIAYAAGNPDDPLGIDIQEAKASLSSMAPVNRTRVALWLDERAPVHDSALFIYNGQVIQRQLAPPEDGLTAILGMIYDRVAAILPATSPGIEIRPARGSIWFRPDIHQALAGHTVTAISATPNGELIATVAVPVQRYRVIQGALTMATETGDVDRLVRAEKVATLEWFCAALLATVLSSVLLASRIARPIRKLADAAGNIDPSRARQADIPNLSARDDEIGDLSQSLRAMTGALLARIDAIQSFAADVAHEIKNPLTSLRSAVETLGRVQNETQRDRLLAVILDDVGRIDRLISDISAASRLDAELARADMAPVDMTRLIKTLINVYEQSDPKLAGRFVVNLDSALKAPVGLTVPGLENRLGQVMRNLIDNALSFSGDTGRVHISVERLAQAVEVRVEDEGPGIPDLAMERIFERFYSERPDGEVFGAHSGLGLSIVKRIVEAHGGTITATNRRNGQGDCIGACFTVRLPV